MSIEERTAELHEGCQMPMEQARALATSELLGRLAESAGMVNLLTNGAASCVHSDGCHGVSQEHLWKFAELVRADERERCAKVAEAAWEIDGSFSATEFAARILGA